MISAMLRQACVVKKCQTRIPYYSVWTLEREILEDFNKLKQKTKAPDAIARNSKLIVCTRLRKVYGEDVSE